MKTALVCGAGGFIGWQPSYPLELGLKQTYAWIEEQVYKKVSNG